MELVHDVPRRGHGHTEQDGGVGVVVLREGEGEEVGVGRVAVKDPVTQTRVVCK